MKTTWNRPVYTYTKDTTLGQLVTQFLEANDNDKEGFALYLVCYTPQIDRWINNEFTVGIKSKLRSKFESATGIELDRLFVISAKHNILRDMEHLHKLKEIDPTYAALLERFRVSGKQMRFDELETYDEILQGIKRMCDICGVPLVAIQYELPSGQLAKWIRDETSNAKRQDKPTPDDEARNVERCILAHYVDAHVYDGDTTRLMVIADALFGPNFLKGYKITSFQELLDALVDEDQRSYPDTILGKELNLTTNAIRKLRNYEPTGMTTFETTVSYLRVFLIKRGYEHVVAEFDARSEELKQNFKEGRIRITPLELGAAREHPVVEKPARLNEPEVFVESPATTVSAVSESPSPVSQVQDVQIEHQVRAFAASMIAQRAMIDGTLAALAVQFPDVCFYVQVPSPVQKEHTDRASSTPPTSSAATRLATSKNVRWSDEQLRQAQTEVKNFLSLIKRICQLEDDQRDHILKSLDPTLTAIHLAIKAASDMHPQAFLAMIQADEEAMRLLRG